jgi:hypothetical protein
MKRILAINFLLFTIALAAQSQEEDKAVIIQQAVETKNFVFKAETVTPQRGRMRQLTPEYDLTIRPDTVIAFLPYFGRAYTAPIGSSDGGIKFTSTSFDYSAGEKKKNRWEIVVRPKDVSDIRKLYLTVFNNGRASLRVISNNRDGISYNGYIKEGNPAGKKGF